MDKIPQQHPRTPREAARHAALISLSDERDGWQARVARAWTQGHAAGHAAGYQQGYEAAAAELAAGWARFARQVRAGASVPAHDQLEHRRWFLACPAGRRDPAGHPASCPDCSHRTRATFGGPAAGEFTGTRA